MAAAALEDGVHLRVTSAYRSWRRQSELFESAVERHGPDQRWVAAPGTSEHQLGTTVDFCDAAMQQVLEPGFADTAEGRWLSDNAHRFGWIRSYTEENAPLTGYEPEPWHYRFGVIDAGESP
jgi:D-alanyl-D-alanine carboxypeptidase